MKSAKEALETDASVEGASSASLSDVEASNDDKIDLDSEKTKGVNPKTTEPTETRTLEETSPQWKSGVERDGGNVVPGAVAVVRNSVTRIESTEATPTSSSGHGQEAEAEVTVTATATATGSITMVEATAVREIIATEVIPVVDRETTSMALGNRVKPAGSSAQQADMKLHTLSLEHVDIDNFDDPTSLNDGHTLNDKDGPPLAVPRKWAPLWQVVSLVSGIIICFLALCFFVFGLFVPRMDDVIDEFDDDSLESVCLEAQQETLFHVEQLAGKGWIEFSLACGVLGALIYQVLDECQDRYCAVRPNPQALETGDHFFYNLVVTVLEIFWFFVVVVHLICFHSDDLHDPGALISDACATTSMESEASVPGFNGRDSGPSDGLDSFRDTFPGQDNEHSEYEEIGDLRAYYVSILCRIPQLIFLLISRGRLLLNNRACQHIAVGWRKFWFWLKVFMEVELFALVMIGMLGSLLPVLDSVRDLVEESSQ